eukprot:9191144-Ditylum_brightwellii.AAC.1
MLVTANQRKHYKRSDPPAILFIPKATMLKTDNTQELNLQATPASNQSTYKFKAYTFSNGTAEDVLEWEKQLAIVIKNKPIDTAKSKFNLMEAILEGNALTYWQDLKHIEVAQILKNPDGTVGVAP